MKKIHKSNKIPSYLFRQKCIMELSPEPVKSQIKKGMWPPSTLSYYDNTATLRSVYFVIFDLQLKYGSQIQGQQKTEVFKQIEKVISNLIC